MTRHIRTILLFIISILSLNLFTPKIHCTHPECFAQRNVSRDHPKYVIPAKAGIQTTPPGIPTNKYLSTGRKLYLDPRFHGDDHMRALQHVIPAKAEIQTTPPGIPKITPSKNSYKYLEELLDPTTLPKRFIDKTSVRLALSCTIGALVTFIVTLIKKRSQDNLSSLLKENNKMTELIINTTERLKVNRQVLLNLLKTLNPPVIQAKADPPGFASTPLNEVGGIQTTPTTKSKINTPSLLPTAIVTFIIFTLSSYLLLHALIPEEKTNLRLLANLLDNWPVIRQNIPEEFYGQLDLLYYLYKSGEFYIKLKEQDAQTIVFQIINRCLEKI